jgi:hypothetical protein
MEMLFDLETLYAVKSSEKLPLRCLHCRKVFYLQAKFIRSDLKLYPDGCKYCSKACCNAHHIVEVSMPCGYCGKTVVRDRNQAKRSKSGFIFCNSSCAVKYNNAHKTTGTRRSKFEKWIEEQLTARYPDMPVIYNSKETIQSELDIYIPSINLAIELNGIFHYEPIYGAEKLASIQTNDDRKFQACFEKGIELLIIDISSISNFKPAKAQKFLDIITKVIDAKLG